MDDPVSKWTEVENDYVALFCLCIYGIGCFENGFEQLTKLEVSNASC